MLVAAVGNPWLRDQGFGPCVLQRLRDVAPVPGVDLEELSFGTVAAFQRLAERDYAQAVFVSATPRGRRRGRLYRQVTGVELPPPDEIHGRVGDGVMGLVSVDNLLVLARYYGRLPEAVTLLEAEPVDDTWGAGLTPQLERLVPRAVAAIARQLARWRGAG